MGKDTLMGKTVKEYLDKFPNTASKTVATIIFKAHPQLFRDIEHARGIVRRVRGAAGGKSRREISDTSRYRITDTFNPFDLPEPTPDHEVFPFELPKQHKNILIMSDLHLPFHSVPAITVALEYGVKQKVDSIILLGDVFDFFAVSRFANDPRKRDLGREIESGRQFLADLKKIFPKAKIYFKLGNHEDRWERYLWVRAPELVGVEIFEFWNIFEFEKHDIQYIHNRSEIHIGNNFCALHGHEFQFSAYSPVNPARGLYLRYKENAICGHFHRPSHHTEKSGRDKIKATWSLGCLCLLRPLYATQNAWLHGYAHLVRDTDDGFHLRNYTIVKNKAYES